LAVPSTVCLRLYPMKEVKDRIVESMPKVGGYETATAESGDNIGYNLKQTVDGTANNHPRGSDNFSNDTTTEESDRIADNSDNISAKSEHKSPKSIKAVAERTAVLEQEEEVENEAYESSDSGPRRQDNTGMIYRERKDVIERKRKIATAYFELKDANEGIRPSMMSVAEHTGIGYRTVLRIGKELKLKESNPLA